MLCEFFLYGEVKCRINNKITLFVSVRPASFIRLNVRLQSTSFKIINGQKAGDNIGGFGNSQVIYAHVHINSDG